MNHVRGLRVLVVGGGIAGLTAAYWLARTGCEVRLVERDEAPPDDAAMIDFYGPGFGVADEMGILPELERLSADVGRWTFEDRSGLPLFSIDYARLRHALFGGHHFSLLHGDLRRTLWACLGAHVDVIRGTSVASIRPYGPRVMVALDDGSSSTFDFVVGAGGAHSDTRRAWFGGDATSERYLGFDAASFSVSDSALRASLGREMRSLASAGRQVTVYPVCGDRVSVNFLLQRDATLADRTPAGVANELRAVFGGFGDVVPHLLDAVGGAHDLQYAGVTQVCLPTWSIGGVVLVGDACYCPSPLGGASASLAMAGARTLARELARAHGKFPAAFSAYERRMRPAVARAQAMGLRMAQWVAPQSKFRMMLRDLAVRASVWPVGSRVMRRAVGPVEQIA